MNGQSQKMAGEEGFEPSHAGIKIQCLNQLGDSPTQVVKLDFTTVTLFNWPNVKKIYGKPQTPCV